jgi:hypothetical protein
MISTAVGKKPVSHITFSLSLIVHLIPCHPIREAQPNSTQSTDTSTCSLFLKEACESRPHPERSFGIGRVASNGVEFNFSPQIKFGPGIDCLLAVERNVHHQT